MKNIVLTIFSIFIAVILGELLIGFIRPAPNVYPISVTSGNGEHALSLNKKLIYVPKSNTGEFNSRGYRGREFSYKRSPNRRRIAFMGDSVLEGLGVSAEKRFTDLLSLKLGNDYELINLGVRGYNLEQEVEYLRVVGRKYDPDLVVFCITFNDLEIHAGEIHWLGEKLRRMEESAFYNTYYRNRSNLHEFLLKSNIYRYSYLIRSTILSRKDNGQESFFKSVYYKLDDPLINKTFDNISKLSKQNKFEIGFVFLPVPAESDQLMVLKEFVKQRNIKHLDLYQEIRSIYTEEQLRLLFLDFCHLSEFGHQIVADLLLQNKNLFLDN